MPLMRALFAVVALVGQLAVGSLVLPDRSDAASLAGIETTMVLCGNSAATRMTDGRATPAHRNHPLQAGRALDLALELPAVILLPASFLPPPRLVAGSGIAALPPARAPPTTAAWAWRARGPPVLA